jgi:integral membrane protein
VRQYFRTLGFVEGVSLLVLLFIAMPIKYLLGNPEAVRIVGMIHGLLFLLYVFTAVTVSRDLMWSGRKLVFSFLVASVPFGPFIFDKKLFPVSS